MSEKTVEVKAEVTRHYCKDCADECIWAGTANQADFNDDGKITVLKYEHRCKCDGVLHQLDKIYPIVRLKEEQPVIQLLN